MLRRASRAWRGFTRVANSFLYGKNYTRLRKPRGMINSSFMQLNGLVSKISMPIRCSCPFWHPLTLHKVSLQQVCHTNKTYYLLFKKIFVCTIVFLHGVMCLLSNYYEKDKVMHSYHSCSPLVLSNNRSRIFEPMP